MIKVGGSGVRSVWSILRAVYSSPPKFTLLLILNFLETKCLFFKFFVDAMENNPKICSYSSRKQPVSWSVLESECDMVDRNDVDLTSLRRQSH